MWLSDLCKSVYRRISPATWSHFSEIKLKTWIREFYSIKNGKASLHSDPSPLLICGYDDTAFDEFSRGLENQVDFDIVTSVFLIDVDGTRSTSFASIVEQYVSPQNTLVIAFYSRQETKPKVVPESFFLENTGRPKMTCDPIFYQRTLWLNPRINDNVPFHIVTKDQSRFQDLKPLKRQVVFHSNIQANKI